MPLVKAMVAATISRNAVTSVTGVTSEVTNAIAGTTAIANMGVIATISGAASAVQAPPRGYHWAQSGGDYLLVAIATGVILQLLLNN